MYSPFSLPNHILKNKKIILFGLLFAFLFFVPFISSAATLSLSPSSGNYNVGSSLTINIYANSADQSINAASGIISFPSDKLTITSVSKSGSIIGFWVQEPSFTNTAGTVNFEGIIFNPGFTGSSGKILSINFKVKTIGTAPIVFSTGSILANDGKGTNILTGMQNASLTLKAVVTPTVTETLKVVPGTFKIYEVGKSGSINPQASFKFDASYKSPGVDHYEVKIDNRTPIIWKADSTNIYQTEVLNYGQHIIIAKAFDKNGNFLIDSVEFTINALEAPVITDHQPEMSSRDTLKITGQTKYANAKVKILLAQGYNEPKGYEIEGDDNGNFTYIVPDKLADGIYTLQAQVINAYGAMSDLSDELTINVTPTQLTQVSSQATKLLSTIVPLMALIFLFIFIVWYIYQKFKIAHSRFNKKVSGIEHSIHKAFELLKEDMRDQIRMLERARTKRQLTVEEDKIIKHFKEDLEDTEKFIRREIQSLEKEVK